MCCWGRTREKAGFMGGGRGRTDGGGPPTQANKPNRSSTRSEHGGLQATMMTRSGTDFADEIDCSVFFDHIDDFLDFPAEEAAPVGDDGSAPSAWTPGHCGSRADLPSRDSDNCSSDHLSAPLSVPLDDIFELEWLSNFVEDSFSGGTLTVNKEELCSISINNEESGGHHSQTSSPVSVLESGRLYSGEKAGLTETMAAGNRRARSKRARPTTFTPRSSMPDPDAHCSESESFSDSGFLVELPKQLSSDYRKKKIRFTGPISTTASHAPLQVGRKCLHCEISKTPQWRAGPMGPKTLCNACGVRYKSGRLFPEYRPAASPTFVPSVHSNSHKKVLEMRNKASSDLLPRTCSIAMDSPSISPLLPPM